MSTEPPATRYPNFDALSSELALRVAAILRDAIAQRGSASLAVSGGKSPVRLFEHLRTQRLDWNRVNIALVDERWVAPSDPSSNEKLVREHLMRDAAAAARFVGLKNDAPTPQAGAAVSWKGFATVPRPLDLVVLGMGEDGHTASLFPKSPQLATALDHTAAPCCIGMVSPSAPQARLSLNLAALLDSRRIVFLLGGDAKWKVYVAASQAGPTEEMPVRAVLRQQHTPVEVTWAP